MDVSPVDIVSVSDAYRKKIIQNEYYIVYILSMYKLSIL